MGEPVKNQLSEAPLEHTSSREPIYLASQLASICAVDLKTIHNWCDRQSDPMSPAELECFRTPGGHLRFRQSAVLRFLGRWGYPIPSELLLDRPQLLIIERDEKKRIEIINGLSLRRPGRDGLDSEQHSGVMKPLTRERTLGLFAQEHWYATLVSDTQTALIVAGERAGAGVPFSLVILRENVDDVPSDEVRVAMQSRPWSHSLQFILRSDKTSVVPQGVRAVVAEDDMVTLCAILLAEHELHNSLDKRTVADADPKPFEGSVPRKDRVKILPREPIFVASQVAHILNVDLKTVHNWVERGDIDAFSTPGRHLRFRRRTLLHFLRRYDMPIPAEISPKWPVLLLVCQPAQERANHALLAQLKRSFTLLTVQDFSEALVQLGEHCAGASLIDAIVLFERPEQASDHSWIEAVRAHPETKQSMLFLVREANSGIAVSTWQQRGVHVVVEGKDPSQLPVLLERTLGLEL